MRILREKPIQTCIECVRDQGTQAKLKENFWRVWTYFNTPCQQNPSDLRTAPLPSCPSLPAWLIKEYRQHSIPHSIMDAKVNHRQHHSSSLTSLHIRQCTYCILGVNEVKEYQMGEWGPCEVRVPCARIVCPSLDQIPTMSKSDKRNLLLSKLGCVPPQLERVEEKYKLFLCSVIYWKREKNIKLCIVQALLACFELCSTGRTVLPNTCIKDEYRQHGSWLQDRESFLEWQCVYQDTIALNSLLKCPFEVMCPSKIYNGKIAMSLASCQANIEKNYAGA